MADKKITELTNITGANLVDADEFVVVDISADETKAITLGELKEAFDSGSGFVRITGDTMTGDLTVPNVIVSGNVDGRDISVDGTKLDTIETNADVTDAANVTSAGALMTTGGTMTGDVGHGDGVKATFGASADLQVFHDGSNSTIADFGTGVFNIASDGAAIQLSTNTGELMAYFAKDGAAQLFYDNSKKLETTATGVDITGTAVTDGLTVAGNVSVDGGTIKLDGNYPVGTGNVALGDAALDSNVSGGDNVAVGSGALTALTTGNNNHAFGQGALQSNVSGGENVAIGRLALQANTASANTAVGHNAGFNNTTGANNTALGYAALVNNTTASYNTAVGYQALYSLILQALKILRLVERRQGLILQVQLT